MPVVNPVLIKTRCAICETDTHDTVLYPANFDLDSFSYEIFSARRSPDRRHYQIVRCQKCGLVRSNPVVDEDALGQLYAGSHFTYDQESRYAVETYGFYFKKFLKYIPKNDDIKLLEIGCGNGFFLEKVKSLGIPNVFGIEPSREAVEKAGDVKKNIHVGMFEMGIYPFNYFDMLCCFQVFDHISAPNAFLKNCWDCLRDGGLDLFINHDVGSLPARILKARCPIIDIEHTYLYDKSTMPQIFKKNQFEILDVFSVANRYPIAYWMKLAPLPKVFKNNFIANLQRSRLGRIPISLSLGNMGILARAVKKT